MLYNLDLMGKFKNFGDIFLARMRVLKPRMLISGAHAECI
jgi:hypothetical protein